MCLFLRYQKCVLSLRYEIRLVVGFECILLRNTHLRYYNQTLGVAVFFVFVILLFYCVFNYTVLSVKHIEIDQPVGIECGGFDGERSVVAFFI